MLFGSSRFAFFSAPPSFALCTDPSPRAGLSTPARLRVRAAPRPGDMPRLAARASPLRAPGLCARAKLFEPPT